MLLLIFVISIFFVLWKSNLVFFVFQRNVKYNKIYYKKTIIEMKKNPWKRFYNPEYENVRWKKGNEQRGTKHKLR